MRERNCPRCGAPLREEGPSWKWLRFFECVQCFCAFELVAEKHYEPCSPQSQFTKFLRHTFTLQPGRTPRSSRP
jgi:hypothetical protein